MGKANKLKNPLPQASSRLLRQNKKVKDVAGLVEAMLLANWRANFRIKHSLAEGETNEADLSLIYQALCWSVELGADYTPTDTTFIVMFNLANIGIPLGITY